MPNGTGNGKSRLPQITFFAIILRDRLPCWFAEVVGNWFSASLHTIGLSVGGVGATATKTNDSAALRAKKKGRRIQRT